MANRSGMIDSVDLRNHENNRAHRTSEMDEKRLIVRRGQPFFITLRMSDFLPPDQQLSLVLHLGPRDEVVIKVQSERESRDRWWFSQQVGQSEVQLTLHSPADALIGQYRLAALRMSPDGRILEQTEFQKFYLLFNPWCRDDAVYLDDERLRQEYVMNEDGIIYKSAWGYGLSWNFGQFEDHVVDICFQILDKSNEAWRNPKMDIDRRSDPVYVSRTVTAMVNSDDDYGVLVGRWHGPYSDGKPPHQWNSSVPILRQWSSDTRGVKYGQCWVYAGVACTVLRCLGIPTRCITNFESAHDVDGNLTMDILWNKYLQRMNGGDSIWNFHCWVESWMRRDDLPAGYDGWQVLDPTPQELSGGVYTCGPCPVKAIKEGDLGVKYDTPFVYAEVNADVIDWIVQSDGQLRREVYREHVGRNISTKSAYNNSREDVTLHYKYPEGSQREREVYAKAGRRAIDLASREPGRLELSINHAQCVFGTDIDIIVEVKNSKSEDTSAELTVVVEGVIYNGRYLAEIQRKIANITVPAHNTHREVLRVRYDQYVSSISEHRLIGVRAMLDVPGQNRPIMDKTNITLSVPELQVSVPNTVYLNQQVTGSISFTNPLPVPLTGGVFTVEGGGLSTTRISADCNVLQGRECRASFSFTPFRRGVRRILVDFDSNELNDVKGVATVTVY